MPYPVLPPEMPPVVQEVAVSQSSETSAPEPTAAQGDRLPEPASVPQSTSVPQSNLGRPVAPLPLRRLDRIRPGTLRDFQQQHRSTAPAARELGPHRALIHLGSPGNASTVESGPDRPATSARSTAPQPGSTPNRLAQTNRTPDHRPSDPAGDNPLGNVPPLTDPKPREPNRSPNPNGTTPPPDPNPPTTDAPEIRNPDLVMLPEPTQLPERSGPELPADPPAPTERPIDRDRPPQPTNATDPTNRPAPAARPGGSRPPRPELPNLPPDAIGAIEVTADRQEFDSVRQIFIAIGNVTMRYQGAVITADRLQVNLDTRLAKAEGNVALVRGQQTIRGAQMDYNLVQGDGSLYTAYGEVFQPTAGEDFAPAEVITSGPYNPALDRPLSDRISANEPLRDVRQTGQFALQVGTGSFGIVDPPPGQVGEVQNFRFQADRVDFDPNGWVAQNVRITNDPFSPPESEIRADRARLRRLSPLRDELIADRPRVVFDNRFSLPLLVRRTVIDRRERPPQPFEIRFDSQDRGGLYIQRQFDAIRTSRVRLRLTPQYLLQKAFFDEKADGPVGLDVFGLQARLTAQLSPTTSLLGVARFITLDPDRFEDDFRGSLRLNQIIPTGWGPHSLTLEYSYRDRLFNGSFGFRTVHRSIGGVFSSPIIPLGKSGFQLNYQLGYQNINAQSDFGRLIDEPSRNSDNRITLDRTQMAIAIARPITLWQGEALPATPEAGLRYSPVPLRPNIRLLPRLQMLWQNYSSGDYQNVLTGSIALQGQLGHFSRPWLDYTGFTLAYIENWRKGESPFLFDRMGDARVVVVGLTQQIYGPFRAGFQQVYNVDLGEIIDSSYTLEYSRRTYGLLLRVDPERQSGSLILRITDFNWTGSGQEFGEASDI